jgi:cell division protein FtsL
MSTATLVARRNQNLYRQPAQLVMGPTSATFVVVALVAVLSLLYLNQVTKTNVFGDRVSALTAQLSQVQSQKQDLSVEAARLSSLAATKQSSVARGMVQTTTVAYAK